MNPVKTTSLLVFDLDGTLADTKADIITAVQTTLKWAGAPAIAPLDIERHIGTGVQTFLLNQLTLFAGASADKGMQFFKDFYLEHLANETKLFEGVLEVLQHYRNRIPMVVLSNKSQIFTDPLLSRLGVGQYFQAIYGAEAFSTRKPDPETLRSLCQRHSSSLSTTVVIGDTTADILCAKGAGADSCAALYGFSDQTELLACHPTWTIHNPRELIGMFQ